MKNKDGRLYGKESNEVWIKQKMGKGRGNFTEKWRGLTKKGTHRNFIDISTITDVFLDQKRVKMAPSLPCVHIHLFSSDWERHLWLSKYLNKVSVCLCVPLLWRSLHF